MEMVIPASLVLCARVFGALLFGAAAWSKARHLAEFEGVFENYRLTPSFASPVLARLLVTAEALVALSLATGLGLQFGAAGAAALMLLFATAIGVNLARGRDDIDCGCFQSTHRQQLSGWLVGRNLAAAILLACPLLPSAQVVGGLEWLDGAGAGVALFVLVRTFEQVLSLRAGARQLHKRFG